MSDELNLNDGQRAWLAGFIDGYGSFANYGKGLGYKARTTRVKAAVARVASYTDTHLVDYIDASGKPGVMITITNEELHKVMIAVWEYLQPDRKREYANLRKLLRANA